jgi:retron-type reverse transcriptase
VKRVNNIYNDICDIKNIIDIYNKQIRINTKNKRKIERFEDYLVENIVNIQNILENKRYRPSSYNIFLIKVPKVRIVMSQNIIDKVINHLVAKYFLVDVIEKKLINQNVATRKNKGTIYGLKLTKKYLNELKIEDKKIYILKCDITKFFYSIDHEILKAKIKKQIKDKDALRIIYKIINSTNEDYVNRNINYLKQKEKLRIESLNINTKEKEIKIKELDKLPIYLKDKGIPIGNMTSQILALLYLNDLDHFIKEQLKIKYYIRYMDDFILMHHSKDYLKFCLKIVKGKVENEYKLKLNKKTMIVDIKNGLDFLGFRFYIKNNKIIMKVRNQTKKTFKKKVKNLYKLYKEDKIDEKSINQVIASYNGHLSYGNTYNLKNKTLEQFSLYKLKSIKDIGTSIRIDEEN